MAPAADRPGQSARAGQSAWEDPPAGDKPPQDDSNSTSEEAHDAAAAGESEDHCGCHGEAHAGVAGHQKEAVKEPAVEREAARFYGKRELFHALESARPDWTDRDLRNAQDKLLMIGVTDLHELHVMLEAGDINAQLERFHKTRFCDRTLSGLRKCVEDGSVPGWTIFDKRFMLMEKRLQGRVDSYVREQVDAKQRELKSWLDKYVDQELGKQSGDVRRELSDLKRSLCRRIDEHAEAQEIRVEKRLLRRMLEQLSELESRRQRPDFDHHGPSRHGGGPAVVYEGGAPGTLHALGRHGPRGAPHFRAVPAASERSFDQQSQSLSISSEQRPGSSHSKSQRMLLSVMAMVKEAVQEVVREDKRGVLEPPRNQDACFGVTALLHGATPPQLSVKHDGTSEASLTSHDLEDIFSAQLSAHAGALPERTSRPRSLRGCPPHGNSAGDAPLTHADCDADSFTLEEDPGEILRICELQGLIPSERRFATVNRAIDDSALLSDVSDVYWQTKGTHSLLARTLVCTCGGGQKPVEEVREGDKLYAGERRGAVVVRSVRNPSGGSRRPRMRRVVRCDYETTSTGTTKGHVSVSVIADHPVPVLQRGDQRCVLMPAHDLNATDRIRAHASGRPTWGSIVEVAEEDREVQCFELELEDPSSPIYVATSRPSATAAFRPVEAFVELHAELAPRSSKEWVKQLHFNFAPSAASMRTLSADLWSCEERLARQEHSPCGCLGPALMFVEPEIAPDVISALRGCSLTDCDVIVSRRLEKPVLEAIGSMHGGRRCWKQGESMLSLSRYRLLWLQDGPLQLQEDPSLADQKVVKVQRAFLQLRPPATPDEARSVVTQSSSEVSSARLPHGRQGLFGRGVH